MNTTPPLYRMAARLAVPLVPHLLRDPRQREAHAARLASSAQLVAWGRSRDPSRRVAWFHASSVGEGLQAEAVLRVFRERHPDALLIYTHFSPSARALAARIGADWSGYLPYDRSADVAAVLEAVRPDLLVFTKVDLWPELACQAAASGCQVALVAGTVETGSSRLRWPARALTRPGYRALHAAGAIDRTAAARLTQLGVHPLRIEITGDPRIDSALRRAQSATVAPWPIDQHPRPLIAGSTWPPDEAVLLAAFEQVRHACPDSRLVLVPHDPTAAHLAGIDAVVASHGLPAAERWSMRPDGAPLAALTLVDQVGILAGLYEQGGFAYVGGGFGERGIHSVLEPAAAGRAVIIGPEDRESRDAALLHAAGALHRLPASADAAHLLAQRWLQWLSAPDEMLSAGALGRNALLAEDGAAERSADLLDQLWKIRA